MFEIKEDEAKEQVDSFLAGGILNYVVVYLVIEFLISPVFSWVKQIISKYLGNTVVAKLLKR